MTLPILYQDERIIVINKPAGMLVHRSWLDKHETTFVMQILRDQINQHVYPVHRLDRPTSGVLVFALDSEMARSLTEQFENQHIQKSYLAVVRGIIGAGRIDYALKPRLDKIADKFSNPNKAPKSAITDYQVLATTQQPFVSCQRFDSSRYSLVRLTPITGRKHQLRRHMKHIFHPIVGDTTYGDKVQNRAVLAHVGVKRLLLHAHQLQFCHPLHDEMIRIVAPLDADFCQVMAAFGWSDVDLMA
ncbi:MULTISPECIES: tRNA pseudouridine(65) synthase TruC [Moraxella]|uniref:tRNA pseudouridine synthase C n=1 Tax=Moraxella catarrhalis TaxID=480 RepID=A0A7Z0UYP4_MORCA|nr:tRNA pseudouridine(65) synthase TruC [Moraxella catarrhalis]OAV00908.1 tRNA pseudouridine synthase C [Moraxella catarrhalis]STY81290.1 tRNA pseudouridine synthase C [Moraxella catarrhalis]